VIVLKLLGLFYVGFSRNLQVADAHRDDGKRFIVRSDQKLSAFLELESAICACERVVLTRWQNFWQKQLHKTTTTQKQPANKERIAP
jgi:hypothetical protein